MGRSIAAHRSPMTPGGKRIPNPIVWLAGQMGTEGNEVSPTHRQPERVGNPRVIKGHGGGGKGLSKKRMAICNRWHRGSALQ